MSLVSHFHSSSSPSRKISALARLGLDYALIYANLEVGSTLLLLLLKYYTSLAVLKTAATLGKPRRL